MMDVAVRRGLKREREASNATSEHQIVAGDEHMTQPKPYLYFHESSCFTFYSISRVGNATSV